VTNRTPSLRGMLLLDRGVGPLLMLPATLLVVVFLVGPFYYMFYTALTDLSFADASHAGAFVGFDNFRKLMRNDPFFWASFLLTLKFVVRFNDEEFPQSRMVSIPLNWTASLTLPGIWKVVSAPIYVP